MIWEKKHLSEEVLLTTRFISDMITTINDVNCNPATHPPKKIGIVGGGPKGMYALERILYTVRQSDNSTPIQIVWFNESQHFGSGNNYCVTQPDNLLINYCIGNIDAWLRDDRQEQMIEQLSLTNWIKKYQYTNLPVSPTDFASRALVGVYLQHVLKQLLLSLPAQVSLSMIVGSVHDIRYKEKFTVLIKDGEEVENLDYLLLATGHCYQNVPPFTTKAGHAPKEYLPSAYPIHHLNSIPKSMPVAILGLGLTFIDICLQLTEGRGGVFTPNGEYKPSGNEPVLLPFSRSNLPIHPRGPIYGQKRYKVREYTEQALRNLATYGVERQIDFEKEVLPILHAEIQYAYYSTMLKSKEEEQVRSYINNLAVEDRFTLDHLLFPKVSDNKNRDQATNEYIDECVNRAEEGELHNPYMAAAAVWRELTPLLGDLYNFGGFTPASHEYLDKQIWSACCRTSFGPPIANMRKISALAKAGIIQFSIPPQSKISYDSANNQFVIGNEQEQFNASYLIDGRIARSEIVRQNSPLYNRLVNRGLVQVFENGTYRPGCIAIDQDGRTQSSIADQEIPLYFYGTPTEGILFDNDSLSRVRNNLASSWAQRIIQLIHADDILAHHE
ncbi:MULTISPECIES: FAD/NAD(P)-binding protein [Sphingobacterium]|uniref:FAD/NAD(P)-binding protein n=1 Tax=Sphingobacterium populi TaxID=1812824 RepID=A0ABW5UFL6_9SPHI|nr:FAD/NAD(P)-binding protein [Sphingobacterium sp. CFCC 11742]